MIPRTARRQHRPEEPSFVYAPLAGLEDDFRFNDETLERLIRNYNLDHLAIERPDHRVVLGHHLRPGVRR